MFQLLLSFTGWKDSAGPGANSADPYKSVNAFYDANADIIAPRSRNIADSGTDDRQIENSINGFPETSQVLIKGLTALGRLHPFIGGTLDASASKHSLILDLLTSCRGSIRSGYYVGFDTTRKR